MRTPNGVARIRVLVGVFGVVGVSLLVRCGSHSGSTDATSPSQKQTGMTSTSGNADGEGGPAEGGSPAEGGGDGPSGLADSSDGAKAPEGGQPTDDGAAASSGEGGLSEGGAKSIGDGAAASLDGGGPATGGPSTPSLTKDSDVLLTDAGVAIVSFGGYLNGESFQQDGIVSFQGYQYAAFWNVARHVVMARRLLPSGPWDTFEFTDYTNAANDAHNTISLGICPGDGTLHVSFDHHISDLHYRRSVPGLLTHPAASPWAPSSFSSVVNALAGASPVTQLTYPRFVTEPDGKRMLFEARIGGSGSGDEYLWEYDAASHAWTSIGMFVNGTIDSVNAYPHGLSYGPGGSRLHMSWCWRETPDASSNHDLLYIYSDDHGRTWKNGADTKVATSGLSFVTKSSAGINVWPINQNRGLINQEHMAVDAAGRVHVLLSHMPDSQADDTTFTSARGKSEFFHYWRSTSGTWTRTAMGLSVVASFRGKLAISSSNNVYAILPDLRIAAASAASNFSSWLVLDGTYAGRFFSDPLIDTARLALEDKISIFYPQKSSSNVYVLDYTVR